MGCLQDRYCALVLQTMNPWWDVTCAFQVSQLGQEKTNLQHEKSDLQKQVRDKCVLYCALHNALLLCLLLLYNHCIVCIHISYQHIPCFDLLAATLPLFSFGKQKSLSSFSDTDSFSSSIPAVVSPSFPSLLPAREAFPSTCP